ncbi:RNA-directed DNA polymerase from mobile element jockey isoform X1 [Pectinophora gossypiella]|uniref:RNA-directed DNA polymerase from mobile element jockey isoform X1 n=1 Tax=Pectinophora gossypiella TaxID=13191 RepID=UPI00214EF2F9|nr:RNA-directed DNA polymerase from mobile element jockey isoform X1 [Pectinophora gossypiella]
MINSHDPGVFAISETWFIPGSYFRLPGFSCLRDDRADGYAGVALFIKSTFTYSRIPLPTITGINAIAAKIQNVTIICIYIPNPSVISISDIESIFSHVSGPVIIVGDFNMSHLIWGGPDYDSIGCDLVDLMDSRNLCLLNDGSPTRYTAPDRRVSAVDLSMCSPDIRSMISWQILQEKFGSDHYVIVISFDQPSPSLRSFEPLLKYRLSRANWDNYSIEADANSHFVPLINNSNVEEGYNLFVEGICKAANNNIPIKKSKIGSKVSPPWWDAHCSDMYKRRKEAEINYCLTMTIENYLLLKKISATAKRYFKKKKRSSWVRFCQSLSPRTPPSLLWRSIKRFRGSFSGRSCDSNDYSKWIHEFTNNLAPFSAANRDCLSSPYPSAFPHHSLNDPFSMVELLSSLQSLRDSSPGIDGIPYSFLKKSGQFTKSLFLSIVNKFFETAFVPESWKNQIIIPILKPGKNPSKCSSYRPIALSSTLCKTMEHMLKRRLEWFVESKNILAKTQYGFRKGLSTTDSIAILTTDIRIALSNNQFLVGVFLDISAAYDNVLLPVLRQKLLNLSIPVRLAYFVCNLLMERSIQVRVQGSLLEPRRVWRGLPQGSVLSPLLYSLYTYDLELCVNSFCSVLQYADDLVLYVSSDSLEEATTKLNQALLYLEDWLSDHGLSLSVGKSSAVVFTRKRSFPDVDISFAGEQIPVRQGVKFLGIYLDKTMSGKDHLNYIVDKCEKNINILRSLSGVWWGSHPYSQKLVYNAIVRSIFDYGSLVLEPCNKTALRTLDKVQYQCLRIILGAMKSSPTNALQVEALDPPLDTRRSYLADRYFSKIIQYNNHPLLPKLELLSSIIPRNHYWSNKEHPCLIKSLQKFKALEYKCFQTNINPLFLTSFDSLLFKPNIMLSFGILKDSPGANAIFDDKINSAYNDWLHLYTDASKADDGRVGAAVWAPKYSTLLSFKCPPICTVFTGEAVALLEAVKFIRAHNFQKTIIFSDSLSCLYAIDSNQFTSISKSPLILQVREILYDCHINNIEVVIAWIPSHTGIRGNTILIPGIDFG